MLISLGIKPKIKFNYFSTVEEILRNERGYGEDGKQTLFLSLSIWSSKEYSWNCGLEQSLYTSYIAIFQCLFILLSVQTDSNG